MGVENTPDHENADMSSPALQAEMSAMEQEAYFKSIQDDLADKGFVITSVEDIIAWARTGSLWWMTFGLAEVDRLQEDEGFTRL